jgi:polyisoprenoid-binding protein YceI
MKREYRIDPAHSSALFTVRHMMITNVRGAFSGIQGNVSYDPDDVQSTSINVDIEASTVNTQDAQRDTHLKSAEFLDVSKFPTISFHSVKVQAIDGGELSITGDLTIHGVTRPVVLRVDPPSAEAKDPWGNLRMGASATTRIRRSDFGLAWNQTLETGGILVGDELKLALDVSLIRA